MAKLVLLISGAAAFADASNFAESGRVSSADVQQLFETEFVSTSNSARVAGIEDGLRSTFASLPKDGHGKLGHDAVRYVLHRYFVQRNGWFIKGLEPNGETWSDASAPEAMKEWVPNYLQSLMEQRLGDEGTSLRELAIVAAALEDLIDMEAKGRMETAFSIHDLPARGTVSEEQLREVIDTYFVMFLLAGNFSASDREDALYKTEAFAATYTGWDEAYTWMQDLLDTRMKDEAYDFQKASRMVEDIGEQYYKFNDMECRDLKVTLSEMEGNKAGRVRLSQFYKKSLYSHWRFTEKADYLRILGALDESDPSSPQVIVPNYIMARPNCLESSNLYAICCRNECEELMGHLETRIGTSSADPKEIVELVSALASDTVDAPRELPVGLVDKLEQVAAGSGGRVPLHGRLFAQWMHHAYPRECPYPSPGGAAAGPPGKALHARGDEHMLSDADLQEQVAIHAEGVETVSELPWNAEEELFVQRPPPQSARKPVGVLRSFMLLLAAGSMGVATMRSAVTASSAVQAALKEEKHLV